MPDALAVLRSSLGLLALAAGLSAQEAGARARQLFLTNCAACHGETGDGKGTTQLDRPARSFQDGGFSFGNTPEALFRTISVGIPGSPMPAFDSSLSEDDRKLVAAYVVTLGPPVEEVQDADTILTVHDRPIVVRGLLPPLGEGLPQHPRGLLIGDPSGITFEYQVDDVRLLALRQGGFVRRTDWTGRGGTPLEPLGKVVHLVEGGKPEACFYLDGKPLSVHLSGTRVGEFATLDYHVVAAGREIVHVAEQPSVVSAPFGTGYSRTFHFIGVQPGPFQLRTPAFPGAQLIANGTWNNGAERWFVVRPPESSPVYLALRPSWGAKLILDSTQQFQQEIVATPGSKGEGSALTVIVLPKFADDTVDQLRRWSEGTR